MLNVVLVHSLCAVELEPVSVRKRARKGASSHIRVAIVRSRSALAEVHLVVLLYLLRDELLSEHLLSHLASDSEGEVLILKSEQSNDHEYVSVPLEVDLLCEPEPVDLMEVLVVSYLHFDFD